MAVYKWANVSVSMQSVLAASKTATAITKANPGVVSATANGYTNGDYVLMSAQGMYQVNNRVFRVSGAATDTFSLEGENTTSYDTFVSGGAQKITFGTTITTATSMNASGGTFDFIDTTTIHSNVKTQIPGLASPIVYTFDNLWDVADTAQVAMKAASDAQTQLSFKFVFGTNGPIMVFAGYIGFTGAPGGNAQDKVTTSATITQFGRPTYYAS